MSNRRDVHSLHSKRVMKTPYLFFLLLLHFCTSHPPYHPRTRPKRGDVEIPPASATIEGEGGEESRECYYKVERKSSAETQPRPTHSKVGICGGSLKQMSDLSTDRYANLYGCPNPSALVILRGGGEFIDWNDHKKETEVGQRWICSRHEHELGWNWDNSHFRHFMERITGQRKYPQCSVPPPFSQHHPHLTLYKEVHRIDADESRAVLKKYGILLHPGLPICPMHQEEINKITLEMKAEETGQQILPIPRYKETDSTPQEDPSYRYHKTTGPLDQKTKAYVALMHELGISPHISTTPWNQLSDRTQRRQAEALRHIAKEISAIMNPDNPKALEDKAFKTFSDHELPRTEIFDEMLAHVKEAFEHSNSRADRLAYLSMVSHLHLPEIHRIIPGLSKYYYNQAKRYARRGYHIESVFHRRVKYIFEKVERFLQFLTSYKVTLGLPYGTRRVKDTQGRWIEIPNTLRKLRSGEIYHLYKKDLEENNEIHLLIPESTVRKMIAICAAEKRKSLHGVDAFDNAEILIDTMLESNWIDKILHASLRAKMAQARQYIRTDYMIHTKEYSTVGDHCWSFALSDPDDVQLQVDCKTAPPDWLHRHTRTCDQCEVVHIFFADLRATIDEKEKTVKGDKTMLHEFALVKRDLDDWETKITKLKKHQLRTAKSERDREKLVGEKLEEGDVMMIKDFAMKQLPLSPREPTTDWYAQRGMTWHITHYITKRNGEYYRHAVVHFIQNEIQDSATVTGVFRHNLEDLQKRGIKRVFVRSDQAGAYKSTSTLASVHHIDEEVKGIDVAAWIFSEAQAGKGPCDRDAAIVKNHVRGVVDAKGKALNPTQFFEAALSGKPIPGFSFHLVTLQGSGANKEVKLSPSKIDGLSKMTAFEYEKDGIRIWRSWEIGVGKKVPYTNLIPNDARLVVEKSGGALSNDAFWVKMGDPHYIEKEEQHEEEEDEDAQCELKNEKKCAKRPRLESTLYRCPIESCSQEFLSEKNLEQHMDVGRHLRRPERMNLLDFTLNRYASFLEIVAPPKVCPVIDEAMGSLIDDPNAKESPLLMGWALTERKKSIRFPDTVKTFLKKLYDEGERTGAKIDAREAEQLMRHATTPNGDMLFNVEHLLNCRQIAGVYAGFKRTKLNKKARAKAGGSRGQRDAHPETEPDEVNDLLANDQYEGDPELEYETEPLFDEKDLMRLALTREHATLWLKEGEKEGGGGEAMEE